jgi:DNA-binding transcriptional ArsR family regulator
MKNIENTAVIFAALADPTRLRLLRILSLQSDDNSICVSALATMIGVSQPAISQHLLVLKKAGLVDRKRHGNHMHYFVKPGMLIRCQEALAVALKSLEYETQPTGVDLCQGIPCPKQTKTRPA